MQSLIPLETWPDRLRALGVFGGVGAITALHLLTPLPQGHDIDLHARHTLLEGLYYLPIFLAAYSWGLRGGALGGGLVDAIYAAHTHFQLGGVLDPVNRSRLLALLMFPVVGLTLGWLTDRLRRETQALVDAERQLRRAEMLAALGELSAGLAHEIRNPLAAIHGAAEVVSGAIPKGSRDEEFARLLLSEIQRLDRVVSDFLLFARQGKPGEDVSDPAACTKETFTLLRARAEKERIHFRLRIDMEGLRVRCPPEALRQVLLNLCLNAVQAIGSRPGNVTVHIKAPAPGLTRIVVDDTGPGVPASQREVVFRPFHTTKEGGTGLGLAVVARIVAGCGGTVEVGEAVDGGARFTVALPAAPRPARAEVSEVVG
jgi:two-component system sensor histidine kinase HydH